MPNASATDAGDTDAGHSSTRVTTAAAAKPQTMPTRPPQQLSATASTRNCSSTSRRLAPTARRSPISRVRSLTETSITFMIPIPPTTSEIAAIAASSAVMVVPARCSVPLISSRLT